MSASTAAARNRIAPGIREDRYGVEAYVKVNGQQFSKRFPTGTPFNTIHLWRSAKRREAKGVLGPGRIPRIFKAYARPLRRSKDGWCYIYFIQDGDGVKIGRAVHPMERLRNLQTGHSRTLTLIAAVPAHAHLELAIHKKFAHLRQPGTEWFLLAEDLEAFIDAIRDGKNPVPLVW